MASGDCEPGDEERAALRGVAVVVLLPLLVMICRGGVPSDWLRILAVEPPEVAAGLAPPPPLPAPTSERAVEVD